MKSNEAGSWKALPVNELPFSFHGINIENGNLYCRGYMDGIFTISLDSNRSYIHDESEPGDSRYSCKAIGRHDSLSIVSGCWNDGEVAVLCLNQKLDSHLV